MLQRQLAPPVRFALRDRENLSARQLKTRRKSSTLSAIEAGGPVLLILRSLIQSWGDEPNKLAPKCANAWGFRFSGCVLIHFSESTLRKSELIPIGYEKHRVNPYVKLTSAQEDSTYQ